MSTTQLDIDRECALRCIEGEKGVPCPRRCGGELDYQGPYPAEPDTGTPGYPGGVFCDTCDFAMLARDVSVVYDEPED